MPYSSIRHRIKGAAFLIVTYFVIQSIIVVAHEHAHSGAAWLLGYTSTPFTVMWGNPITIMGWDEGVPYDDLFHSRGCAAEAIIGGVPLLMHVILVAVSLLYLWRRAAPMRASVFFIWYLVAVMNLAELVAYIFMRPFIPNGDTGRFNEGFDISPWPLFFVGSAFILASMWILARRIAPQIDLKTDGSLLEHKAITWSAGFVMFLWSSGLRMIWLYPDPQWKTGLIGIVGLAVWILLDRQRDTRNSLNIV